MMLTKMIIMRMIVIIRMKMITTLTQAIFKLGPPNSTIKYWLLLIFSSCNSTHIALINDMGCTIDGAMDLWSCYPRWSRRMTRDEIVGIIKRGRWVRGGSRKELGPRGQGGDVRGGKGLRGQHSIPAPYSHFLLAQFVAPKHP